MAPKPSLLDLPPEIQLTIFKHLNDATSVVRLGSTCSQLAALSRDESIWKSLACAKFPDEASDRIANKRRTSGKIIGCDDHDDRDDHNDRDDLDDDLDEYCTRNGRFLDSWHFFYVTQFQFQKMFDIAMKDFEVDWSEMI